jgi:hypothetical protein
VYVLRQWEWNCIRYRRLDCSDLLEVDNKALDYSVDSESDTDLAAMSVDDSDATATAAAAAPTALPPMETFFFSHFGEIRQGEGAATITAAMTALDDKVGGIHTEH